MIINTNFKEIFTQTYNDMHVADQTICINNMLRYFLDINSHNQYYVTNITAFIIEYTYDLVKFLNETDITIKLGYKYCIRVLKNMYKDFKQNSFKNHEDFISEYKKCLDIEINTVESDKQ
jgi:hypothetical protein